MDLRNMIISIFFFQSIYRLRNTLIFAKPKKKYLIKCENIMMNLMYQCVCTFNKLSFSHELRYRKKKLNIESSFCDDDIEVASV